MRWTHWLAVLLGFALASPALWLPHLWHSFVWPGVAAVALQAVALGDWARRETFFKLSDYVYYLLLGAAVTIASTVLLRADEARQVNARVEQRSLEGDIAAADQDLPRLAAELQGLERTLQGQDAAFVAGCRAQVMLPKPNPGDRAGREELKVDPCLGFLGLEGRALEIPRQIERLRAGRAAAQARLEDLRRRYPANGPTVVGSEDLQQAQREFELRWLTLLALLGAAIKLGKTTSSLRPLPKPSR